MLNMNRNTSVIFNWGAIESQGGRRNIYIWQKETKHIDRGLFLYFPFGVVIVQVLSCVHLFAFSWTAAHQASLSFTISQGFLKLMFIESVMPSNHISWKTNKLINIYKINVSKINRQPKPG